mmetsp:Transcript_30967/g.72216  ORF Transcript_30967/g.72216 Transcript_30967/m.72216 type:complete len:1208 (-) Transcript_30967:301-3924(-)
MCAGSRRHPRALLATVLCSAWLQANARAAAEEQVPPSSLHPPPAGPDGLTSVLTRRLKPHRGRDVDFSMELSTWNASAMLEALNVTPQDAKRTDVALPCKPDEKKWCQDLRQSGIPGVVARCLKKKLDEPNPLRMGSDYVPPVSKECQDEVEQFFMIAEATSSNQHDLMWIEPVKGFREACKSDAERVCPHMTGARLVKCFEAKHHKIGFACKSMVKQIEADQAKNPKLDVPFYIACKEELEKEGKATRQSHYACSARPRVEWQVCLEGMAGRGEVSESCAQQLWQRKVVASEDIKLNHGLFSNCTTELDTFCHNVVPGEARQIKCLYDHTLNRTFSAECRTQVLDFAQRHLKDYRLDYRIRTKCETAIDTFCAAEKDFIDHQISAVNLFRDVDGKAGSHSVLQCLKRTYAEQDEREGGESSGLGEECEVEIKRIVKMHSISPMADKLVWKFCQEPIDFYCKHAKLLKPERIQKCLRFNIKHKKSQKTGDVLIDSRCQQAVILQEALESRTIELKPLLRSVCSGFIEKHCQHLSAGGGQIIACLEDNVDHKDMSPDCKEYVRADMEATSDDYRLKYGVSHACKADVREYCAAHEDFGNHDASVLDCLKESYYNNSKVSPQCQDELSRHVRNNEDGRNLTRSFDADCRADVEEYCGDILPGAGNIRDCLLRMAFDPASEGDEDGNDLQLSDGCKASMERWTRHEAVASMDVRFSKSVMTFCKEPLKTFCADFDPRDQWSCLEDHLDSPGMTGSCKKLVQKREKTANQGFAMAGPQIKEYCEADAKLVCPSFYMEEMYKDLGASAKLMACLMRMRKEVQNQNCATALLRKALQRVRDIRTDPEAEQMCATDIHNHCFDQEGYGTSMMMCLKKHFDSLEHHCKKWLFHAMKHQSDSYVLNPNMHKACYSTAKQYCPKMHTDSSDVIECLLDHMHDADPPMPTACQLALVKEEEKRGTDISFNPALYRACKDDVELLQKSHPHDCPLRDGDGALTQGKLINCLVKHRVETRKSICKMALYRAMKHHSDDVRAKPTMTSVCHEDLERFCDGLDDGAAAHVHFGQGRKHECLRDHMEQLSKDCREMVSEVQEAEGEHAELNPGVRMYCKNEMATFCSKVEPGEAVMLTCLDMNKGRDEFSVGCRKRLDKVHINELMKKAAIEKLLRDVAVIADDIKSYMVSSGVSWGTLAFAASVSWISFAGLCLMLVRRRCC